MKKYRLSIILWLVFEAIAVWLWQASGNLLKTTTKYDTLGCFGMGVAFDGVYIKVKQ